MAALKTRVVALRKGVTLPIKGVAALREKGSVEKGRG